MNSQQDNTRIFGKNLTNRFSVYNFNQKNIFFLQKNENKFPKDDSLFLKCDKLQNNYNKNNNNNKQKKLANLFNLANIKFDSNKDLKNKELKPVIQKKENQNITISQNINQNFVFNPKLNVNFDNNFFIKNNSFPIQENDITNIETKGAKLKESLKKKEPEKNLQLLDEYSSEIFETISETEYINIVDYSNTNIFITQDPIKFNEKIRGNILQWLIYTNNNFNLFDDTVFLSMNLMDRYLSKTKNLSDYKLIAITSYFIASKYEDIYPPFIEEICQICNFSYTPNDVLCMEHKILDALDFDILYTSAYKFLTFFYSKSEIKNQKLFFLAEFILELSLESLEILKYSQMYRAVAALSIAKKIMKINGGDNQIKLYFNYNEEKMRKLQKKMVILLVNTIKSTKKNYIVEKFDSEKYGAICSLLNKIKAYKKKSMTGLDNLGSGNGRGNDSSSSNDNNSNNKINNNSSRNKNKNNGKEVNDENKNVYNENKD